MVENVAAWIDAPYADLQVRRAPMPVAGPGQLLVRVRAVAVNPLDAVIQSNGTLMYGWLRYPVVLGEDVAGEVVAIGADVRSFAVGDRVIAYAMGLEKGRDARGGGGFQTFVAVEAAMAAPIPAEVPYERTVVLPLAVSTAAAGLFEAKQLGLDASSLGRSPARDETVVIWGGATSVGGNAIQLARAAGYQVITTASPRNHARMHELGARAAFDYRSPDVVERVAGAASGTTVVGVLAIATGSAAPSIAIARATQARRVAMASPPVSFYDQPRRPGVSAARIRLIARLASRSAALQLRSRAGGVRASYVWGSAIADSEVGAAVWERHLPAAIASGMHVLYPDARVVGSGLAEVQGAIDAVRAGVSAQKLVVRLDERTTADDIGTVREAPPAP